MKLSQRRLSSQVLLLMRRLEKKDVKRIGKIDNTRFKNKK